MWDKFEELLAAVGARNADGTPKYRRILVRSCNGAGKTAALAALCNWKLSEYKDDCIILTTASSWTQVQRGLWAEIRNQAKRAALYTEREMMQTQIRLDEKRYAIGISPTQPENAQGFHAKHMLIAVDEATGVQTDIIDALWGNATGKDAQMVLIYNPINTTSYPFTAEQSGQWKVITISAFEHPNVKKGKEIIPGAVTREWVDDRLMEWSQPERKNSADPTSQVYVPWQRRYYKKTRHVAARLCGEWPLFGGDGLIDILLAQTAYVDVPVHWEKVVGVDVARFGQDMTVFAPFIGGKLQPLVTFHGKDLMHTADEVEKLAKLGFFHHRRHRIRRRRDRPAHPKRHRMPPVNFSSAPWPWLLPTRHFANLRTQAYHALLAGLRANRIRIAPGEEPNSDLEQEIAARSPT